MKKLLPLIIQSWVGTLVLWVIITILLIQSLSINNGHFIYALDDPYIHMAIAKNFAASGIWGVTAHEFTAASSSPLWVLLLAAVAKIIGSREIIPFIVNLLCATGVVLVTAYGLRAHPFRAGYRQAVIVVLLLVTPLPLLVFTGMEHALHVLLTLLFLILAGRLLAKNTFTLHDPTLLLTLALAPVLVMARYESLFLVGVVAFLLVIRKRWSAGLLLLVLGIAPVVITGLLTIQAGGSFLPNSIMLKGKFPLYASPIMFLVYMGRRFAAMPAPLLVLLLAACVLVVRGWITRRGEKWGEPQVLPLIFIGTTLLHTVSGGFGWLLRYEAYLIAAGVYALAVALYGDLYPQRAADKKRAPAPVPVKKRLPAIVLALVLVTFLGVRAFNGLAVTARATGEIYRQQYQMARFLHTYYNDASIAANDIGAITYFTNIRCFDMYGLANNEVALAKLTRTYDALTVQTLAEKRRVSIAVCYESWFPDKIPANWRRVGTMTMDPTIICGSNAVSFFAVDPAETERLAAHLRDFSAHVPEGVVIEVSTPTAASTQ